MKVASGESHAGSPLGVCRRSRVGILTSAATASLQQAHPYGIPRTSQFSRASTKNFEDKYSLCIHCISPKVWPLPKVLLLLTDNCTLRLRIAIACGTLPPN